MEELRVVKKVGAYNKDGKVIIPFEYEKVWDLNDIVYEAITFEGEYHLYTSKGKVEYPKHIVKITKAYYFLGNTYVLQDNEKVYIGEIDFEKNAFNVIYERFAIKFQNNIYYISVFFKDGSRDVFSHEEKKVVLHLKPSEILREIEEGKGFIVEEEKTRKFYDISGNKIAENCLKIITYDKVFHVLMSSPNARRNIEIIYSYTGEKIVEREHLPDVMYALHVIETIINEERTDIITSIKKVGDVYLAELLDIKGKVIFSSKKDYMKEMLLYDNDTILFESKNLDMLCKLKKDDAGAILVKKVLEADGIENVGFRKYRVRKDDKILLYDSDGNLIQLKQ